MEVRLDDDSPSIVKILSWNIARRAECWERLIDMGGDVVLLQEAAEPPPEFADRIDVFTLDGTTRFH